MVLVWGLLIAGGQGSPVQGSNHLSDEEQPYPPDQTVKVVASTPWTAAFARAAGAGQVDVLAPYAMRHPPEYELRPSDLVRVSQADMVIYGGYERMTEKLLDAAEQNKAVRVQITTTHTREILEQSIMSIAQELGTQDYARTSLDELFQLLDNWQTLGESLDLHTLPVVSHVFQVQLMEELGVNVVGTFGPGPLEAGAIGEFTRIAPVLIIDNWHNPVAGPLGQTLGNTPILEFLNIPGHGGTDSLADVFKYNMLLMEQTR